MEPRRFLRVAVVLVGHWAMRNGTYKLNQPPPVPLAHVGRVVGHPDAELHLKDVLDEIHVRHGPVPDQPSFGGGVRAGATPPLKSRGS